MELKDLLGVATLGVSVFAAWSAYQARLVTEELKARELDTGLTVDLLEKVHAQVKAAPAGNMDVPTCIFVRTLAQAEEKAKAPEPRLVRSFVEHMEDAGRVSSNCVVSVLESGPEAIAAQPPPTDPQPTRPAAPGEWHAVIASYPVSDRGCQDARDDVPEFARLLEGTVPAGARLGVVQTFVSRHYAVTVDLGDDRTAALNAAEAIRAASSRSADRKTGADAFVQQNRTWQFPPGCEAIHRF